MTGKTAPRAASRTIVGLGIAAALAVGVSSAWPQPDALSAVPTNTAELVRPIHPADGPVRIVDVETSAVWADEEVPPVRVKVENTATRRVTAKVWWILAAPEDTTPWAGAAEVGRAREVQLDAGQIRTVLIAAPRHVPPGAWNLSLWAHTARREGGSRHSHGVSVTPTVHVLPTHPDVYRLSGPGRYTALGVVEPVGRLVGLDADSGPDALVSVEATTSQPARVQLRCYLAPQGTAEPWTHEQAIGSYVENSHVEAGIPQSMGCRFPELPGRGAWELSAFLRLGGDAKARAHEDGLYSRRLIDFDTLAPKRDVTEKRTKSRK